MRSTNRIIMLLVMICLKISLTAQGLGQWTWVSGDTTAWNYSYGSYGVADSTYTPGTPYEPAWWADDSGNFWLYGGMNCGWAGMWKYSTSTKMWALMQGNADQNNFTLSHYGVKGIPSPLNTPGHRQWGSMHWKDTNGKLWLFGGEGFDVNGTLGELADLWCFETNTLEWTWIAGSNVSNTYGNYGKQCLPSPSNYPPPRMENKGQWVDRSGNLWLFGGYCYYNFPSVSGCYDDVWMFDISTNQWIWISGNKGLTNNSNPTFNNPGARNTYTPFIFKDSLYSIGHSVNSVDGNYPGHWSPTLYRYDISSSTWKYLNYALHHGSTIAGKCNTGTASEEIEMTDVWQDTCGAWFLGSGNDLWYYNFRDNNFTYICGNTKTAFGQKVAYHYGSKGVPSNLNLPPLNVNNELAGTPCWKGPDGNFWLYTAGTMWRFTPDYNCISNSCPVNNLNVQANFIFNTTDFCAPYQSMFINTSNSATQFYWDFGDGTSSAVKNPVHSYALPGNYTVTLKACDSLTCDSIKRTIYVYAQSKANFNYSTTSTCLPAQLNAFNLSINADTNKWYIDNALVGTSATLAGQNVITPGTHTISLITNTIHNCRDSIANIYRVDARAHAVIKYSDVQECDPNIINLYNWSTNATSYSWNIEGYGVSHDEAPYHVPFGSDGHFTIYLLAQTPLGCNDDTSITIEVDCDSAYVQVPNIFSPNHDNVNNLLELKSKGITDFKMDIFNRWGKRVFYSEKLNYSWNGRLNNTAIECDEGTYYYTIETKDKKSKVKEFKGFVTLVR